MFNKPQSPWLLFACCYTLAFIVQPVIPQNYTCYPVQQCSSTPNTVDTLMYTIPVLNWEMGRSGVCPRSDDSGVSKWQIEFERNSITISGNFCSIGISFNSSTVCYDQGSLIFLDVRNNEFSESGDVIIQFNETNNDGNTPVFETQFLIIYRPTGVYAAKEIVQYNPEDPLLPSITWRVYVNHNTEDVKLYFNNELIPTNRTISETTVCFDSTPSPDVKTSVYTLFVLNPSIESAGNYTLVIGGFHSTVILELDPAYVPPPTPQPNVSMSESLSPSMIMSSLSPSVDASPTLSDSNDDKGLIIIIVPVCIGIGILIIAIIAIAIAIFIIVMKNTEKDEDNKDNRPDVYTRTRVSVVDPPPAEALNQPQPGIGIELQGPITGGGNNVETTETIAETPLGGGGPAPNDEETDTEPTPPTQQPQTPPTQQPQDHAIQNQLERQTNLLERLLLSNQQQVENTGRTANNTEQIRDIQSEQLDTQRDTNELLQTGMIGEDRNPLSSASTPTVSTDINQAQPSTISLPTSTPPPSNIVPPQASAGNRPLPDDHTHQILHPQSTTPPPPIYPGEDTDEETDHAVLPIQDIVEGSGNEGDIIERGVPQDVGDRSSTPDVNRDSHHQSEHTPPPPGRGQVTTEKQLRTINIKTMDLHPESAELARALGLDEATISGLVNHGDHQHTDRSRLQAVFVKWKRKGGTPTWRVIYEVLVAMRHIDLAQEIQRKYTNLDTNVPFDDDGYIQTMTDALLPIEAHWYYFALHLDLDYSTLDEIEGVHRSEIHLSKILRRWKAMKAGDATIEAIIRACEVIGHRDIAERLRNDDDIKREFPNLRR